MIAALGASSPQRRRGLLLAAWLLVAASLSVARADETHPLDNVATFDIPSQPLEDALYAFGMVTGVEVFADGGIVKGRQSTAIRGSLEAGQALRQLLTGTGLDAEILGARAITLAPTPRDRAQGDRYRQYSALLQQAALRQLCRGQDDGLGGYRIALQLWLDEAGAVRRLTLLSSTGDEARDRRIRDLIEHLSAGKPPMGLPQPVVMVILPRRDNGDCAAGPSGRP